VSEAQRLDGEVTESQTVSLRVPSHGHGKLMPPWPKGVSQNPGGIPRKPYAEAHRKLADLKLSTLRRMVPGDLTVAEAEARRLKLESARGNVRAAIESADRTEGKVPLSLTGADGSPLIPDRSPLEDEAARLVAAIRERIT